MAGDARDEGVQRSGLAVRDQVGRLPGRGGRPRRQGQALDAEPEGRRDVLPEPPLAADVDRRPRGDRRRRGRRARRGGPARLLAAPGADQRAPRAPARRAASRRRARRRARLPGVRPALPRRPIAPRRPARGPQAPAPERPPRDEPGPLRVARRRRGRGVHGGRRRRSGLEGDRRQAAPLALRAGPPHAGLAEAEDPPEQELVVGGWTPGEGNARDLGAVAVGVYEDGKLRFAGKVGSGFTAATRKRLLAAMAPLVDRRAAVRSAAAAATTAAAGAATSTASRGSGRSS